MILKGESIFNYLNNQIQFDDPSESSHWKLYHSSFKFTGTGFEGLAGFGGCDPEYKGLKNIIVNILQFPFRAIGRKYSSFGKLDKIAKKFLKKASKAYDIDVLRQVITLAMLVDKIGENHNNALVIGDGFSSFTSLAHLSNFSKKSKLY